MIEVTCQRCKENGVPRNQRLLAQVTWLGEQPQVWVYEKRLNKRAIGSAAPGQPATRSPLKIASRVGMVRLKPGESVTLRCHGCSTQFPSGHSELVRRAGQVRKSGDAEFGIGGLRKKSRPRR